MSEKVDVVYTLADLSKNRDDWELRYSLRSLAQQDWVGKIFMIGYCPSWVKNVVHIPCDDPFHPKDANIINKVMAACKREDVSNTFVVNSDDHYIMRPVSLWELGPWLENPSQLPISYAKQYVSTWHKRLVQTIRFCVSKQWPQWVFECHIPYLICKEKYLRAFRRIPWRVGNGICTHVYFNVTLTALKNGPLLESVYMTFRKKEAMEEKQFLARISKCTFFNHNNKGLDAITKEWMEKRFPTPSPWEKKRERRVIRTR